MKYPTFCFVLLLSLTSLAENMKDLLLVKDGSVARCELEGDVGSRAFTLKAKAVQSLKAIELEVKTFKCVKVENKVVLVPTPLSVAHEVKVNSDLYTTKFTSVVIAVTNVDRTIEFGRVSLSEHLQTQKILVAESVLGGGKVDITILSLAITEKNGQVWDQGMTFGGHYRLSQ